MNSKSLMRIALGIFGLTLVVFICTGISDWASLISMLTSLILIAISFRKVKSEGSQFLEDGKQEIAKLNIKQKYLEDCLTGKTTVEEYDKKCEVFKDEQN